MEKITTGKILGYTLLPRVLPRMRDMMSVAFSHTAYFVALIFETVRLLPHSHPYLQPEYFGQYSVSQVIGQAYRRLRFSFNHIDQILIFGIVVAGILIFFAQIIILAFSVMFPFAQAAPYYTLTAPVQFDVLTTFTLSTIIETEYPQDDIAFMLLDRVFGVDDMFNSRYDPAGIGVGDFPYPYHLGLHTLFQTFSIAMLTVGLIVLTYFVITILAETVRDGTPFGRRFNRVWAPIRLVLAFGLLVPMTNGLNAAQYIVLISAKWGSGFATNGLQFYYGEIHASGETPFGPQENLIAQPNAPDPAAMIHFMLTARACQYASQFYNQEYDNTGVVANPIRGYYLHYNGGTSPAPVADPSLFDFDSMAVTPFGPYIVTAGDINNLRDTLADTTLESIILIFGERDADKYPDLPGNVNPTCGTITIPISTSEENPMAFQVQAAYLTVLSLIWGDQSLIDAAAAYAQSKMNNVNVCNDVYYPVSACPPPPPPNMSNFKASITEGVRGVMQSLIIQAVNDNIGSLEWCGPPADPYHLSYGWAGAAICYNRVAQYNGDFTSAVMSFPRAPRSWPRSLEFVRQVRQQEEQSVNSVLDVFNPYITGNANEHLDIFEGNNELRVHAEATYEAYRQWARTGTGTGDGGTLDGTGGGVKGLINFFFGTEGLFNMTKAENRNIHPLSQLASAGRGLIQSAINNIGFAALGTGATIIPGLSLLGQITSSFVFTFAIITMSAGFILYYLIPLMPFIYFFFAVAAWLKGIFEAMVGVPLWALAHLRIDGDGIPGNAAMTGYLLILEIFLRPIMIVFGLIASSLIFSAMAKVLNEMWSLVVENLTGFDQAAAEAAGYPLTDIRFWRTPIDEFFYTVIYVIIIYMMAIASFKLVDLIPNYIMRWLGQSVETFAEGVGNSAEQLQQKATVGVSGGAREVIGGAGQLSSGIGQSFETYRNSQPRGNSGNSGG